MLNDFIDIFTQEVTTYQGRSGKTVTFKHQNERKKFEDRLLNIRKLSNDLVEVLINNSKYETWPDFIRKKNKDVIKQLKCKQLF
jgi:hypothetical protein